MSESIRIPLDIDSDSSSESKLDDSKNAAESARNQALALGRQLERIRERNLQVRREILDQTEQGERLIYDILNLKSLDTVFRMELAECNLSWAERMRINDPATRPQHTLPKIGRPKVNHL